MEKISYLDRETGKIEEEKVYKGGLLKVLYNGSLLSRILLPLLSRVPLFSKWYGFLQKTSRSKKKIAPFIEEFDVDTSEFQKEKFKSFNDFFIRKLKPSCRPLVPSVSTAVLPADGRYLAYPDISKMQGVYVKGKTFSIERLLGDPVLARRFARGSLVSARLCPTDYHRYHFPCLCTPGEPRLINGPLFSVNPIALRKSIDILTENKRIITPLATRRFGEILYIEVGATNVGSIQNTFRPGTVYEKGEEKGYFEFGGSCLLLLFEPRRITLDADLVASTKKYIEVRGKLGQSLGSSA